MGKKTDFEGSLEKLKQMSEKIKDQDIGLEESIKCYEEGMKHYEKCMDILKEARQKIETVTEEGKTYERGL